METDPLPPARHSVHDYLKKLALLVAWVPTSIFALGAALFLLASVRQLPMEKIWANASNAYALFSALPNPGQVLGSSIRAQDARPQIILDFLETYRSPMASPSVARKIIEVSDACETLPWTWLVAIAGKESGFGKVIPVDSFNAWGWAVYTGQNKGASFTSWEGGVEKVGQGLCDYTRQGVSTIEALESYYTPQSAATHRRWRDGVNFFIWQLESWQL